MDRAVRDFSKREEHATSDSTFVVIMSHGKRDAILGVHWDSGNPNPDVFHIDKMYNHLNTKGCPGLRNKPKVILIQACRGGRFLTLLLSVLYGHFGSFSDRSNHSLLFQVRMDMFGCRMACRMTVLLLRVMTWNIRRKTLSLFFPAHLVSGSLLFHSGFLGPLMNKCINAAHYIHYTEVMFSPQIQNPTGMWRRALFLSSTLWKSSTPMLTRTT